MDVIWFYVFAVIPFLVGGLLWATGKQVVWQEWLGGTAIGFAMAGIFHAMALFGQTSDVETWSGQLVDGRHIGRWQEYYEEAVYRTETYQSGTDSKGNPEYSTRQVFDHWSSERRWHDDEYHVNSNIDTSHSISKDEYYTIAKTWGGVKAVPGKRTTGEHASKMIGGDPNDYVMNNKTGYIWPVTKLVSFENRIKATPTTFSYSPVPVGTKVFPYPENKNAFMSDRLLGSATLVNLFAFDQMNARLGPTKKVNVILVGFGDRDSMAGQWQEAAWIGGKKNDVVICWGGLNSAPTWVRAFGWTEKKTCLRQLESLILEKGISEATLPLIEAEIKADYVIKDWKKFDYIRVPAPTWSIVTYLVVAVIAQSLFWWWANANEFKKIAKEWQSMPRAQRREW